MILSIYTKGHRKDYDECFQLTLGTCVFVLVYAHMHNNMYLDLKENIKDRFLNKIYVLAGKSYAGKV